MSSATRVPATRRGVIDLDKLMDVVDKMRIAAPQDLRDAEAILTKRDTILEQALGEAYSVRQAAEEEARRLVEEGTTNTEAILAKRDTILEQVRGEARSLRQAAEEESQRLVEEGTIKIEVNKQVEKLMVDAQERAQKLLEEAETEATERRSGADSYIKESLSQLETEMTAILDRIRRGMDVLKV